MRDKPSKQQPYKVDYFKAIYAKMHKGIVAHPEFLDETNVERHLRDAKFAFLCLDGGNPKALAMAKLMECGVPFIDVGMGLVVKDSNNRHLARDHEHTAT